VSRVEAARFLHHLQNVSVDQAVDEATGSNNPLREMLGTVSSSNVSEFEDCAGLRSGYATRLATAKSKESAYRAFLKRAMGCAGSAFRDSGDSWPTEDMAFDMMELASVDWLKSTSLLFQFTSKYKPQISALPQAARKEFSTCMQKMKRHPGVPGTPQRKGLGDRRRPDSKHHSGISEFDLSVADVSGQPMLEAGRSNHRAVGPQRRLMKGFGGGFGGFFFGFFSGTECTDDCPACFGKEGSVLNSQTRSPMRIGDVKVGDRLTTTIENDEVWYLFTTDAEVQMVKLVLMDSVLEITASHLVSTETGMRLAGSIKLGDNVWTVQGLSKVQSVERYTGEVTSPITKSGTIVVNGVVASCYAFGTHEVIHMVLAPFRALHNLSPGLVLALAQFGDTLVHSLGNLFLLKHNMDFIMAASALAVLFAPFFLLSCFVVAEYTSRKSVQTCN
jgi:hypothetical protein